MPCDSHPDAQTYLGACTGCTPAPAPLCEPPAPVERQTLHPWQLADLWRYVELRYPAVAEAAMAAIPQRLGVEG